MAGGRGFARRLRFGGTPPFRRFGFAGTRFPRRLRLGSSSSLGFGGAPFGGLAVPPRALGTRSAGRLFLVARFLLPLLRFVAGSGLLLRGQVQVAPQREQVLAELEALVVRRHLLEFFRGPLRSLPARREEHHVDRVFRIAWRNGKRCGNL